MALFYVEGVYGCGIRQARSLAQAEADFRREVGSYGYKSVRPASKEDVDWVTGMGGYLPTKEAKA